MKRYLYFLGITFATLSMAPLAAEARVDGSGRQVVGERADRPRQRLDEAPIRGKHRTHWHFGLNLSLPPRHFCIPPPCPPSVVYVDRPAPVYVDRPVYIERPAPVVYREPVVEKNEYDRSVPKLKLTSSNCSEEYISLDGFYGKLKSFKLEVKEPGVRLDLNGDYPKLEKVKVESRSGNVRARLRGCFSDPDEMNFSSTSGDIDLDLRGRWKENCTLNIDTESGDIILRLPPQIGVRVQVNGQCHCEVSDGIDCRREGFRFHEYTNRQFDRCATTLKIYVNSDHGRVVIN